MIRPLIFAITVRAEPVEALPPFDRLRANGIGYSPVIKSSIDQQEYSL